MMTSCFSRSFVYHFTPDLFGRAREALQLKKELDARPVDVGEDGPFLFNKLT